MAQKKARTTRARTKSKASTKSKPVRVRKVAKKAAKPKAAKRAPRAAVAERKLIEELRAENRRLRRELEQLRSPAAEPEPEQVALPLGDLPPDF
jgi:hypothetical protein